MEIRGAPAIGVSAAFGMALAALYSGSGNLEDLLVRLARARKVLWSTRPTAYNLFWALKRVDKVITEYSKLNDVEALKEAILAEALRIYVEDVKSNVEIGRLGSKLIEDGDVILTHCNTGSLATAGFGTALGVIRYAWYEGKRIQVVTTETRPVLQGARLNVWELKKEGIPFRLIVDSAAGLVLSKRIANKVIVGADRIILTGHTANKIGTLQVALAANHANAPFYVAAPTSTIQAVTDPKSIVIEERSSDEVIYVLGEQRVKVTLEDVNVYNPSFDITPPHLITAIITEKGIAEPPYESSLSSLLEESSSENQ